MKHRNEPDVTLEAFERGEIDVRAFDHEAHVYVAWLLLQSCDVTEAMERFRSALKRLTRRLGIPGKYHETITCFFVLLINERNALTQPGSWSEFRNANPDVLDAGKILRRYYERNILDSELAGHTFILPSARVTRAA